MGVVKCPKCGLKVSDSTGECFACGCRLPKQTIVEEENISSLEAPGNGSIYSTSNHNFDTAKLEQSAVQPANGANIQVAQVTAAPFPETNEKINLKSKKNKQSSPLLKRILIINLTALLIGIICALGWYFGIKVPRDKAFDKYVDDLNSANANISQYNDSVLSFNEQAKKVIAENDNFDSIINNAQELIDLGDTPYEGEKITELSNTIKDARNHKVTTPELLETVDTFTLDTNLQSARKSDIEKASESLIAESDEYKEKIASINTEKEALIVPDYSSYIELIEIQGKELEDSYAIQRQITNPSEEWVITRLGRVDDVANIAAATEEHDPNDHLHKPGGYTSAVFFSTPLLNTEDLRGYDLIEEGTSGGGSVEVYSTIEDAERRNEYLGGFDGTSISSGSHIILGTMLIRTSDELMASQQVTLSNSIINEMIKLE